MLITAGCPKTDRFPFVCDLCPSRYKKSACKLARIRYEAASAQSAADGRLVSSRVGIDSDEETFSKIDEAVKSGADRGDSVYQSLKSSGIDSVSVQTVYRWINKGMMSTKRIDLPKAVRYKPRRKRKAEYDYGGASNSLGKDGKRPMDYIAHRAEHPNEFGSQMDYLGTIKTDRFAPLTISIPVLQTVFVKKLPKGDGKAVAAFLDAIEGKIGTEAFGKVFPYILTDNDVAFGDGEAIEASAFGGKRTKVFFCDPYSPSQKPHIENKNGQLRRSFPKKSSVDGLSDAYFAESSALCNSRHLQSLGGKTPEEAFAAAFGQDVYDKIMECIKGE